MNRVFITGNVGNDPQLRTFQDGGKVANLSVASSERWKDKNSGEKREKTEWHRVSVFGGAAGVVEQYVKKGDKIAIEGKLQTRKWQDQSGQDRYTTEIVVQPIGGSIELLGGSGGGQDRQQSSDSGGQEADTPAGGYGDMGDSIPFAPEWRI